MTISSPVGIYTCGPGALVTISGSGFGTSGFLALPAQGGLKATALNLTPASWSDAQITFVIPDGAITDTLAITAHDASTASVPLRIVSQYVTASEYRAAGEGVDVSGILDPELDAVLQRASSYTDAAVGYALRLLQQNEQHIWKGSSRRIFPYRWPIVSVDQFVVRVATQMTARFNVNDFVINNGQRYIETLEYAVANYVFMGAIQNLGLSANIVEVLYTAGYTSLAVPQGIRDATVMIATELLTYRRIQKEGFGGFSSVKQGNQQFQRRNEEFAVPQPALDLLKPYRFTRFA